MSLPKTPSIDIVLSVISESIDRLKQLDKSPRPTQLTTAIDHLISFRDDTIAVYNDTKIDKLVDILNDVTQDATDVIFAYVAKDEGNGNFKHKLVFNDRHVYLYNKYSDMPDLLSLITHLSTTLPSLSDVVRRYTDEYKDDASPIEIGAIKIGMSKETIRSHAHVSPKSQPTVTYVELDNNEPSEKEVVYANEIDTRLDDIDIDERKKQNVEHLKTIKDKVLKRTEDTRNAGLQIRAKDFENYLLELPEFDGFITFVEKWLLDKENDKKMDVISFSKLARDQYPVIDGVTARTLIEITIINMSNELLDINKFTETDKSLYVPLSSLAKEYMVAMILANLKMVTNHQQYRDYDVSMLAVYIINYCNNNSSLTIAETPEEVTRLIEAVYGVFLAKDLDPSFISSADVNSQHDVIDPNWFLTNKVIQGYLARVNNATHDLNSADKLRYIENIIDRRDKMMTSQRLSPADTNELFLELMGLHQVNAARGGYNNGVYAIGGAYLTFDSAGETTRTVFIVVTNTCVCVIIKMSDSSYVQEFYNETTTFKLVRWLDFLTSKLEKKK